MQLPYMQPLTATTLILLQHSYCCNTHTAAILLLLQHFPPNHKKRSPPSMPTTPGASQPGQTLPFPLGRNITPSPEKAAGVKNRVIEITSPKKGSDWSLVELSSPKKRVASTSIELPTPKRQLKSISKYLLTPTKSQFTHTDMHQALLLIPQSVMWFSISRSWTAAGPALPQLKSLKYSALSILHNTVLACAEFFSLFA